VKLGRLAPDYSKSRLWLEDYYIRAYLPTPPVNVDRCSKVSSWPMYLNDRFGDCTCAGMGHLIGAQSAYAKPSEVLFTNTQIQSLYEIVCPGFNPVTDANDNGAMLQTVLQAMSATNPLGVEVTAFAQLKATDINSLKLALYLFGSVYIGVNLPQSAETQFSNGQPWTYVQGDPIAGGHCVCIQKITPDYLNPYTAITWGGTVRVQSEWMNTYLEEAWVAITPDWIQSNQHSIDGVDVQGLIADAAAI
jgi:hypothetical protein